MIDSLEIMLINATTEEAIQTSVNWSLLEFE